MLVAFRVVHSVTSTEKFAVLGQVMDQSDELRTTIVVNCRIVKQIGQGSRLEKARKEGASAKCWSGGYGRQVVSQSQAEKRKNGENKIVSGLPYGCAPLCRYAWACKGE